MARLRLLPLCLIATGVLFAHARAGVNLIIDPRFGSTENTGSTASITFDFRDTPFGVLLRMTLRNTTPSEIGSRLSAVGLELPDFLVDRPAIVTSEVGAYFDTLTFDSQISPEWLNAVDGFDIVLSSDGNFLEGSTFGAPAPGEYARITLVLGETGFSTEELTAAFEEFYATSNQPRLIGRFQDVGPNGELFDVVAGGVPEPATLVLLALGAIVVARRSKRLAR